MQESKHSPANLFPHCTPDGKTVLFQSHCLSLYGAALWNIKCKQLKSLEIAFNNILRTIWWLPRKCHTSILHSVARLDSIYNRTARLSDRLNSNACNSKHLLIRDTFSASSRLAYTPSGSNHLNDHSNYEVLGARYNLCRSRTLLTIELLQNL